MTWNDRTCDLDELEHVIHNHLDTPRTDKEVYFDGLEHPAGYWVDSDFARQLERELAVLEEVMIDVGRSMDNGWSETLYLALDKVEAMRRAYEEGKSD